MLYPDLRNYFKHLPTLETDRLILRKIKLSDYTDIYEYSKNPEVSKYLTWSVHKDLNYTKNFTKYLIKQYKKYNYYDWGIVLKDTGKFIGTCGFSSIRENDFTAEVGYVLNPEYTNRGYAKEALQRIMYEAYGILGFLRLEARLIEGNEKSEKLLLSCGFVKEGVGIKEMFVKNESKNIVHYGKIKKG